MTKRPNILFLMSDEHRADVTGFEGNTVVRTPVLDELARTGVVFSNCYTPSPICIPGRQAMMSGNHCMKINCLRYGHDLEPFSMTFAKRFSQYAYNTVCSGKLHHMGPDQMQGWTQRIAPDAHVGRKYIDGFVEEEADKYKPENGCGKWSNQKEIERAGIGYEHHVETDRDRLDAALKFAKKYFADSAYDRPGRHQPLMLKLSLNQPHYPFFTDQEKFTYYLNRVPIFEEETFDHPVLRYSQGKNEVNAATRDLRRATAAYYGMVETIDCHYGELMRALEHYGENLDEWIIVYTTDHGDMLGEHGIWEKTRFFEASARVPLIIRWPRGFEGGRVIDKNVNLVDLFATLCDLADIPTPEGLDSRSLAPFLQGEDANWDNETISHMHPGQLMIKGDSLKYQWYGADIPEVLFDLERDPKERENFINDPAYADKLEYFQKRRLKLGYE